MIIPTRDLVLDRRPEYKTKVLFYQMSVRNIKQPVTKLDDYNRQKVIRKSAEKVMAEIKEEFQAELEPGQVVIGSYTVKTEEHERNRLMSVNDAAVALENAGYSKQAITKILNAITVTSTARQFLVKRQ